MDKEYRVFTSEALLYRDKKFNHCARFKSILIQRYVFKEEEWDKTLLYPLVIGGAKLHMLNLSSLEGFTGTQNLIFEKFLAN